VRSFAASDAETDGHSGSKCTHFSLHRFDADNVLISALCSKQDTSTVSQILQRHILTESGGGAGPSTQHRACTLGHPDKTLQPHTDLSAMLCNRR
jgi:hypothetical protein